MQRRSILRRAERLQGLPLSRSTVAASLRPLIAGRPTDLLPCAEGDPAFAAGLLRWVARHRPHPTPVSLLALLRSLDTAGLSSFIEQVLDVPFAQGGTLPGAERSDGPNSHASAVPSRIGAPSPATSRWPAESESTIAAIGRYARCVAQRARDHRRNPRPQQRRHEDPYLAGLLDSMGMLALTVVAGELYRDLLSTSRSRQDCLSRERDAFETDHDEVARRLAQRWNLPTWLIQSRPAIVQDAANSCWPILVNTLSAAAQTSTDAAIEHCSLPDERVVRCVARLVQENSALRSAQADLLEREKLEALAEFAAGAGHEINNPLAVIYGRAQLLLSTESDPERRQALLAMAGQATRIHEMITDLMLFARPPQPQPVSTDMVTLVAETLPQLQVQAIRQGISLDFRSPEAGPVTAHVDPTQMRVVLSELIRNSFEALQNGGRVEISVEQVGPGIDGEFTEQNGQPRSRCIALHVADTGPGIPADVRRHLFDPFYSGRQAGRGLGTGLAKCWRIVQNHSGRIIVANRPQGGAVFSVMLQAATTPAQ